MPVGLVIGVDTAPKVMIEQANVAKYVEAQWNPQDQR